LIAETDREQLTPRSPFQDPAPKMAVLFADIPEALASHRRDRRALFVPARSTRKPILPRFHGWCSGPTPRIAESDRSGGIAPPGRGGPQPTASGFTGLSQGTSEEDYHARLAFEIDVITPP